MDPRRSLTDTNSSGPSAMSHVAGIGQVEKLLPFQKPIIIDFSLFSFFKKIKYHGRINEFSFKIASYDHIIFPEERSHWLFCLELRKVDI